MNDPSYLLAPSEFQGSCRMNFMWNSLLQHGRTDEGKWSALNVGCADDPFGFKQRCVHFDLDDWSKPFAEAGLTFVQGNVHHLTNYFKHQEFQLVICGDTLEHCPDPWTVVSELTKVAGRYLCLTIWEEWRLPSAGRHIEAGQKRADEEVQELGYEDRLDHQRQLYPDKVTFSDEAFPHLIHIWQFTDEMIGALVGQILSSGFDLEFYMKVPETMVKDHLAHNWLILAKRRM